MGGLISIYFFILNNFIIFGLIDEKETSLLTDKEFEKFLIENDALDKFIYNLEKYGKHKKLKIENYCNVIGKKHGIENYLFHITSFNWYRTLKEFKL